MDYILKVIKWSSHFVAKNLKPNFSAAKLNISWTAAALDVGIGTACTEEIDSQWSNKILLRFHRHSVNLASIFSIINWQANEKKCQTLTVLLAKEKIRLWVCHVH